VERSPLEGRRWSFAGRELFVWGGGIFICMKYGRKIKYIFWYALCSVEMLHLSVSSDTGFKLGAGLAQAV
jgi:hypothetical protein